MYTPFSFIHKARKLLRGQNPPTVTPPASSGTTAVVNYPQDAPAFGFDTPLVSPANSWGTWLRNQPAPLFKAKHRLSRLSVYLYGQNQEYALAKDECDRWGYALNIANGRDAERILAEGKTANPPSIEGQLTKLALNDPVKYPVMIGIDQLYPDRATLPAGYVTKADGTLLDVWSPVAPLTAMQAAITFKFRELTKLKAAGIQVAVVYDGGETGLSIPLQAPDFAQDARVVADKGSDSWVDYISRKKGEQQRLIYSEMKRLCPERQVALYYPLVANPYANIPGANEYTWNYSQLYNVADVPGGSVYYRDVFAVGALMTNPGVRDRAYYDQLTHWTAAVAEQLAYGQPLSYCWVSAGWIHPVPAPTSFLSIPVYKGFLKAMYCTGMTGAVAGYFTPDADRFNAEYTPYAEASPPSWLLQQMALGEVHARFSWLDEYIFDGDLLEGNKQHLVKAQYPAYEFDPFVPVTANLYTRSATARVFVRKIRGQEKWLIVAITPDNLDGTAPANVAVVLRDVPGLPDVPINARAQGSIYTLVKVGAELRLTQVDLDDVLPAPVVIGA